ncbi:hypothetical protein M422DRAFT_53247 [Sphaerobolus stellatus SS14]|uniref:Unplaced genomic scaffold SPHSTscaffold_162, whole genome shotgun sequence n=1 Tax=Sphaerobolus stellatus (strain SS14) TaxID=990650 RepID=A0A0C9V2P8_SPHS4|nr:hypothetical protein M422DRAFT_53247 [Sphaerobolus stellatus SS14]
MENLSVYEVGEILIGMWAIPASLPAGFQIDHVKQVVGGIVNEIEIDSLLTLVSALQYNIEGQDGIITVDGLLHLLQVVAASQCQDPPGPVVTDPDLNGLRFRHLGIPKADKTYFENCIRVSGNRVLTENEAILLWGSTFFSTGPSEQFQTIIASLKHIWNILPKYPGGMTMDPHAATIGLYLSGMAVNLYVPYSLPSHIYYTIFHWFQTYDKEEPAEPIQPYPVTELIQKLDINAIAQLLSYNIKQALQSTIRTVSPVESLEERMTSSLPQCHIFLQIGNTELNKAICLIIDQLLGWQRKHGGLPPPLVTAAEVDFFHRGDSNGPTSADFRLDWEKSPHSGWNLAASFVFADYFMQWAESSSLRGMMPKQKMSRDTLSFAFRKRFYRLQAQYWKSVASQQPPVQNVPVGLSVHTISQECRERRRHRKKRRFENRQDIILAHPEWDTGYWEAHEALGVDGTSSDESEDETCSTNRFYRIPQPWRSRRIDRMVGRIDDARDEAARRKRRFIRSGRVFRVRIGDHPTKKNTKVPPGLPLDFYNAEWLSMHPEIIKQLAPTPFIRIPEFNA